MLNRCLFFIFTVSSFTVYSQGLVGETGYNESYSITSDGVVANHKGSFFVRGVYHENSYFTSVVVSYIDSMSNIEWQLPVGSGELNYVTGVSSTGDGGIYIAVVSAETCDVFEDVKSQIWKINDLGSMTLFKEYIANDYHFFEGLTLLHNNHLKGIYAFMGQQAIVEYDESGVLVDSITVSENFGNKQFLNASGYSAIGIRHSTVLTGYDALGNSTPVKSYTTQTGRMLGNGSHIYLTTSDSIFQYDLSLNLVNSELLPDVGEVVQLRFLNDSTIGYLQHVGNSVSWGTLNTSLQNQQSDFYGNNLDGDLSGDFYQNRVSVGLTYGLALYYGARSVLYRKNSPISAVIPQTDVALTAFEVVNQSAVLVSNPNVYQVDVDLNVTIKNQGSFPVTSIRINRDLGPGICNETMKRWYFTGLNLQPGDSIQLELGSAGSYINAFTVPEIQSQVCLYSSFVNELADLNVSNDQHCENIVFGYVGIHEFANDDITLFPNPSSGDFCITRSGNEKLQITVYSVAGSLVRASMDTTEKQINLHLDQGIYLVQLVNEAGNTIVKRVVVN
jgi:hypothetical protein